MVDTPASATSVLIGFIGAGAVGSTLARALTARGARVVAVAARTPERAEALAAWLPGAPLATSPAGVCAACELVFLATPDDALASLATGLPWRPGQGVVHLSGARGADALAAVVERGARPAALHPLMTFPRALIGAPIETLLARLTGCAWALDTADAALRQTLDALVAALDGYTVAIPAEARVPYHLAATLASNYVVTLLGAATALWADVGVERSVALEALLPLLRATVESLATAGLPDALTGPIARGDVGTVAAHLAWLDARDAGELDAAYRALARLTLPLAEEKGALSPDALQRLRRLLDDGK